MQKPAIPVLSTGEGLSCMFDAFMLHRLLVERAKSLLESLCPSSIHRLTTHPTCLCPGPVSIPANQPVCAFVAPSEVFNENCVLMEVTLVGGGGSYELGDIYSLQFVFHTTVSHITHPPTPTHSKRSGRLAVVGSCMMFSDEFFGKVSGSRSCSNTSTSSLNP